ncbi:MAG: hypothetical protein KatS3mg031_0375 [Chitinophagales bacterium]|nr:MAG: hypothetical protein KatS3mg031_0375 [Chitinophagales bacterium]
MQMSYLNAKQNEIVKNVKGRVRALLHPLRQKILTVIKANGNKICVTDIYVKLRIEQSVASQHLAILREAGFVKTKRDGKKIWYSVNDAEIKRFLRMCKQL